MATTTTGGARDAWPLPRSPHWALERPTCTHTHQRGQPRPWRRAHARADAACETSVKTRWALCVCVGALGVCGRRCPLPLSPPTLCCSCCACVRAGGAAPRPFSPAPVGMPLLAALARRAWPCGPCCAPLPFPERGAHPCASVCCGNGAGARWVVRGSGTAPLEQSSVVVAVHAGAAGRSLPRPDFVCFPLYPCCCCWKKSMCARIV